MQVAEIELSILLYIKFFCSTYLIRLVICVVYLRVEYSIK